MTMGNKNTDNLVEGTLNSLEGIAGAETKPWFYARLQARMNAAVRPLLPFWLKPALVVPLLAVLISLNIWSITQMTNSTTGAATACDFADYYNIENCESTLY